jgi:hypothetical protein
MPPYGRRTHLSNRGPGPRARPRRTSSVGFVGTAIIAVLAVVVVVLAYRLSKHTDGGASAGDVSALEARVDELNGRLNQLETTTRQLARQAARTRTPPAANGGSLEEERAQMKTEALLGSCLGQIQRQIDDLQAYLAYGTAPRRDRVSGGCVSLLQPRFRR